jgi:hypothetical protein
MVDKVVKVQAALTRSSLGSIPPVCFGNSWELRAKILPHS